MITKLFIAKTGNISTEWLPLYMHLKDTAGIMKKLTEEFLSESFCKSCDLCREEFEKVTTFLAYAHDIGKATIGFQYKIGQHLPDRVKVLEHEKLLIPSYMSSDSVQKTPHALAGEAILRYFNCPEGIAAVVGAHHGIPAECGTLRDNELDDKPQEIVGYENYYGDNNKEFLEEIWLSFIQDALDYSGYESLRELPQLNSAAQMILSGLIIAADWIASNIEYFPLIDIEDEGDGICYNKRIENAWEKIDFPEMWKSIRKEYSNEDFNDVFSFEPRNTQRELLDIVEKSENAGLYILEAPMGCGKTEASLASAELMAAKFGKNGMFFGMPTQATANGIFPRIMNWAEKQSQEYFHSIQLKHGSSALNKAFMEIQKGIPDKENDSGIIIHKWFCDNKKACLADFVVATVDQMLMMALKRRHVMLLHLGLSEKVVIIDEVHAYDAYMNQYLERALQWLGTYHTPVILLSATLPANRRMSLIRAYLGIKKSDIKFEENKAYPLLTWTDGVNIYQKSLSYIGTHKSVKINQCHNDEIIDIVKTVIDSGGCVGIILNTVNRAQTTAEMVRNEITDNVLLYHAQYIMTDRAEKESELLERIGKSSTTETRNGFVVVGTQVLEQSLDIDFDLLITDVCPMDLLLQRLGRLHRHDRDYRPIEAKEPVCYVITDEYEDEKSGSRTIYGGWLLKETLEFLPGTITLPDDISPLVQKVYNAADDSEEYRNYIGDIKILQSRACSFLIDSSDDSIDDTIHNLLDRTFYDNNAEASVRDGVSSIEVLAMQKKNDDTICFMDGTPLSVQLTDEECQRIAEQKLRLPSRFSNRRFIDDYIKEIENKCKKYVEAWQKFYLLNGQLVLFFDESYEAELGGYKLKYSYENGLICEKE
ncbi:MAG: CRISPR-associated helicase Cas3' [Ruminococcus sp.]|nr:CRISPR-associated helicase Cas3' [Ruminococcus sp.]